VRALRRVEISAALLALIVTLFFAVVARPVHIETREANAVIWITLRPNALAALGAARLSPSRL
jgi:hypothetical protein